MEKLQNEVREPDPFDGIRPLMDRDTIDAIVRLNKQGPRYTSYPTAPVWSESVDGHRFAERIAAMDATPHALPLSLYVHLPFCRHMCRYCGCNVIVTNRKEKVDRYLDYVEREIALARRYLTQPRRVSALHWGGGTPTFLDETQLTRLWNILARAFELRGAEEVAIEVDPRVTSSEQLTLLRRLGFNRVSMGIQDTDPEVQEEIGRHQPLEMSVALYRLARRLGYRGINFDLIYGLPRQTVESFGRTATTIANLKPDRISLFSYAHVPWLKPQQAQMNVELLPSTVDKWMLFEQARQIFLDAGYLPIGMDHFSLPDDSLAKAQTNGTLGRNFQGYTPWSSSETLAFGVTAISDIGGAYAQNVKRLMDYYRLIDDEVLPVERGWILSAEDRLRRDIIHDIMCRFSVDVEAKCRAYHASAEQFAAERDDLVRAEREGLIRLDGWKVTVSPLGQRLVRNVAMTFDAYFRRDLASSRPIFSQTV